jgi:hypothetical protein
MTAPVPNVIVLYDGASWNDERRWRHHRAQRDGKPLRDRPIVDKPHRDQNHVRDMIEQGRRTVADRRKDVEAMLAGAKARLHVA